MNKYFFKQSVSLSLFVCLMMICTQVRDVSEDNFLFPEGLVSFYLSLSSDGESRADGEYNENRFSTIDIYFYDENAEGDEAAL